MPRTLEVTTTFGVRLAILFFVLIAAGLGVFLSLGRVPVPGASEDRYRVALGRIEAERARGRLDATEAERLRAAVGVVQGGADTPVVKVLRGEAFRKATAEVSACRIVDLSAWLDEAVGVADCTLTRARF